MKLAIIAFLAGAVALQAADTVPVASLSTVLSDIATNVGGDKVTVTSIVKPGIDPHEFEPSPGDVKAISQARLVLAAGLGFESFLSKVKNAVGSGPTFVVVGDSITPIMTTEEEDHDHEGHEHEHGAPNADGKVPDPHWWHSIENVKIATRVIRDALIQIDPANTAAYQANAKAYLAKLNDLAKWTKVEIAKLPKSKRILVTSHDALGYFARDYSFEIFPVQGISTSDQPSSQKVQLLIKEIKDKGVKAIFAENIENPKVLSEITRETGAKLGGTIYADGLGDKEANTYDSMIRHNVTTIVEALQ